MGLMKKKISPKFDDAGGRRAIGYLAIYIGMTMLVSCLALLFNIGLVYALFTGIAPFVVAEAYSKQLGQFVLLLGPFLLLFPEWLLYDILVTPFRHKR